MDTELPRLSTDFIIRLDVLKFEMVIPGLTDFYITGSTGIYCEWEEDAFNWEQQMYKKYGVNGPAIERLGIIYYFD